MKTFAWNDLPYRLKCCPCYGLHPLQAVMSADNVVALAERQIQVCETSPALPCSMFTINLSHQLKISLSLSFKVDLFFAHLERIMMSLPRRGTFPRLYKPCWTWTNRLKTAAVIASSITPSTFLILDAAPLCCKNSTQHANCSNLFLYQLGRIRQRATMSLADYKF